MHTLRTRSNKYGSTMTRKHTVSPHTRESDHKKNKQWNQHVSKQLCTAMGHTSSAQHILEWTTSWHTTHPKYLYFQVPSKNSDNTHTSPVLPNWQLYFWNYYRPLWWSIVCVCLPFRFVCVSRQYFLTKWPLTCWFTLTQIQRSRS